MVIRGPWYCCFSHCCCSDIVFQARSPFALVEKTIYVTHVSASQVKSTSGYRLGDLRKKWGGLVKENATDADSYGVSYPKDMLVGHKVGQL